MGRDDSGEKACHPFWMRTSFSLGVSLITLILGAHLGYAEGEDSVSKEAGAESGGTPVHLRYALTLPADHDPGVATPAVLALAPGPQTEQMVDIAHRAYWDAAEQRGWIVVSPVAPEGRLFFDGAENLIPNLLAEISERFAIEGDAFHVAGISNGGIAAFRVAENDPELFCSILAAPGLPGNEADFERLERLGEIPVRMVVGENDTRWVDRMRATETRLKELGLAVELSVLRGEGHIIAEAFPEEAVFAYLEGQREGCRAGAAKRAAAARAKSSASE